MKISGLGSALGAALMLSAMSGVSAQNLPSHLAIDGTLKSPAGKFRTQPDVTLQVPHKEKIIGKANFVPVRILSKSDPNYELSRKVGIVFILDGVGKDAEIVSACSGSLVAHDLFLTNHHCVVDDNNQQREPGQFIVSMEYLDQEKLLSSGTASRAQRVVKADSYLDYALLQLSVPLGKKYGWLELERSSAAIGAVTDVKIIQHPDARPKEIVVKDTKVVANTGRFLHYLADTEGGSSGSPVFALNGGKIIALHHVGTNSYNEGALADLVAKELAPYLPGDGDGGGDGAAASAGSRGDSAVRSPTQPVAAPAASGGAGGWGAIGR